MMSPDKLRVLAVVLSAGSLISPAALATSSLPPSAAGNHRNTPVESSAVEPIDLQFKRAKLADVIAEVSRRSGVRFEVAPHLLEENIDADINGHKWNAAIRSLLAGFNHFSIVDREGNYRKIWITGLADSGSDPISTENGQSSKDDGSFSGPSLGKNPSDVIETPVALWQSVDDSIDSEDQKGKVPSKPIQADSDMFANLRVGQPLELDIPQEETPLYGVVGETHDQLNGEVQVWSGPIDGSHETASFTVTRGESTTYATVATGSSIYEVSIDNATGQGTVVNEADINKASSDDDFVVAPHPHD